MTFRHRAGVRPYTSYSTLQSPVFLVNSCLGLLLQLDDASGVNPYTKSSTPSSEVTGSGCRVPKRGFSLAPEDFLLAYLCRFAVRVPKRLLRGFSRQRGVSDFAVLADIAMRPQDNDPPDLPGGSPYSAEPTRPIVGSLSLLRLPIVITSSR